jgi:hypothetical protein
MNNNKKSRNIAVVGATIFLAAAVAIGAWIRKL